MTDAAPPKRTLKMTIAYDGTDYCGWQTQPNGPSIQSALTDAIESFLGERPFVAASGRTDAGVHALGQVVSFETTSRIPAYNFRPALQSRLPEDITIETVEEVAPGFHAQFDASRKHYRYIIHNSPTQFPFLRRYCAWHRVRLDDRAMQAGIDHLVGTHDFQSLETQWPNRATSVRTIDSAVISRHPVWPQWSRHTDHTGAVVVPPAPPDPNYVPKHPDAPGDFVVLDISADGFLYNMVRTIMGTLIHVGRGKWSPDFVKTILDSRDRKIAGETAPACGLYLVRVEYDPARSKRKKRQELRDAEAAGGE